MNRACAVLLVLLVPAALLQGCGSSGASGEIDNSTTTVLESTEMTATTTMTTTTNTTVTTTTTPGWGCSSDFKLSQGVVMHEQKGFAVDDSTLENCHEEMFAQWPHSGEPIANLRFFVAYKPWWDSNKREAVWQGVKEHLTKMNGKLLLGTAINEGNIDDQQSWEWTLALAKLLGPKLLHGIAFGNEMDDSNTKHGVDWSANGALFQKIQSYVAEMDQHTGFSDVPITVVFTAGVISSIDGYLGPFLRQMHQTYGKRFAWSYNPYSLWDHSLQPHDAASCHEMTQAATGVDYIQSLTTNFAAKVTQIVGSEDYLLWLTEAGWSSPAVTAQHNIMSYCPEWGSKQALSSFYEGVTGWDLSLSGNKKVDLLFLFTMRDAHGEAFGFVDQCGQQTCKIQAADSLVLV